ncbi:MAG: YjgN family protein [Acidiferrobacteraceae bacterium]|jgi:uncharacterized membrane protein YjgN (DUF898 family)
MQTDSTTPTTVPLEPAAPTVRELPLEFRGRAADYFRVWAVNLCLTLLSLGIFSAWAKVRRKRYFYAHTVLDGTPFQYLGQPLPILRGRIIATILFLFYYAGTHYFSSLLPYVLVTATILAPWVVARSLAFNARYSAFRNMTFAFQGGGTDALKVLYAFAIVPLIVLCVIFGWWGKSWLIGFTYIAGMLYFPWWLANLRRFIVDNSEYGGKHGSLSLKGSQYFKMYLLAGLILFGGFIVASFGLGIMIATKSTSPHAVMLFVIPFYVVYVLAYAFTRSRGINLVWNQTRLGPLRFESSLRAWGLMGLYVSNAIGILATAGLLIPWAVTRTMKYRADHMRVFLHGNLEDFTGTHTDTVQATGAEVGDFFDLDLSL